MTKRSLILAGGGVKVAYQAGVLQVWLDEAGLQFDHADGASGGCFNLAMWTQGMTGTGIADAWRNVDPVDGIDPNWSEYVKLLWGESIFELDRYRRNIFPAWGVDWTKIRASSREATFNVYNFTRHELRVVEPRELTEDLLIASVSLPMWFPPVVTEGDTYIDSVFNTDANIEEAIRRGADELWVIWTVSERGQWFDGFIGNYFGIIEAAANGRYKQVLQRIERSNAALRAGTHAEFERPIVVRELKAEVPLHYLINFSKDRAAEAVNRGVADARAWCAREGIALTQAASAAAAVAVRQPTRLQFTEDMKGYVAPDESDPRRGYEAGAAQKGFTHAHMVVRVADVHAFLTDPDHDATIEGWVTTPFGEQRPIDRGVFNLFVDSGDPTRKRMLYRLQFTTAEGMKLTLSGEKQLEDDGGADMWADATTLFVRVYEGHVDAAGEAAQRVLAAGIIRISMLDFGKQLTTFRTEGPTVADRASALARFGAFFLGRLWDVYARHVLPVGPI